MRISKAAAVSAAWFAAPATLSALVPWLLTRWRTPYDWDVLALLPVRAAGVALIALGAPTLVGTFVRFVREGHGSPLPAVPTDRLVVNGAYRRVRNPMYVAVVAVIAGHALLLLRPVLLPYLAAVWLFFVATVRLQELPYLRRTYGEQYEAYRAAVPAWCPRLRPWRGPDATR